MKKENLQDIKPTLFQLFSLVINMFSDQSDLSNSSFKSAGETYNNRSEERFHNERKVYYSPNANQSVSTSLVLWKPHMSETGWISEEWCAC